MYQTLEDLENLQEDSIWRVQNLPQHIFPKSQQINRSVGVFIGQASPFSSCTSCSGPYLTHVLKLMLMLISSQTIFTLSQICYAESLTVASLVKDMCEYEGAWVRILHVVRKREKTEGSMSNMLCRVCNCCFAGSRYMSECESAWVWVLYVVKKGKKKKQKKLGYAFKQENYKVLKTLRIQFH